MVGSVGMSYAWLPVMSMLLFLSFVLLPRTGQTGPVGIRGWGCSMGGIDEMIQRSGVAVVTVCLRMTWDGGTTGLMLRSASEASAGIVHCFINSRQTCSV
jgi:hypothetical protein